jgi:hypothetical protein
MAASIKRITRKTFSEIIQSKDATTAERLEACRLLWKILASATKGKPRGGAFARKAKGEAKNSLEVLAHLLAEVSEVK